MRKFKVWILVNENFIKKGPIHIDKSSCLIALITSYREGFKLKKVKIDRISRPFQIPNLGSKSSPMLDNIMIRRVVSTGN